MKRSTLNDPRNGFGGVYEPYKEISRCDYGFRQVQCRELACRTNQAKGKLLNQNGAQWKLRLRAI